MKNPSILTKLLVAFFGERNGWIRCPRHSLQHDPLKHGYDGPWYYRECKVKGCGWRLRTT